MKSVFVIFCFSIILYCPSTNGGRLREVAISLHEKAHLIREDIRDVLHPKTENPSTDSVLNTDVKPTTSEKVFAEITTSTTTSHIIFPDTVASTVVSVKPDPMVISTTVASTTTQDSKDGRENFSGSCSTGFKKTADGRCKSTFLYL